MNYLAHWVHTPFAQALGWTLVHFLWEGAALAAVLMAVLRLLRWAPARRRYALACLFLAAMPLAFAATLMVIWSRQPAPLVLPVSSTFLTLATPTAAPLPAPAPRFSLAGILDRLAWLAPLWFAGVAFFYARGVAGWLGVQRLRRRGVCAPPSEWQARVDRLAARLRVSRPVALLESCLTDTPVLVGYLRPVILLPLGCLTGLSTAQVECILLHELAHVVRHDYLVNLLQSLVEGLLFYHPAVWWASRVVRAERENCCDDQVVEQMGDARSYAATLAALEQRRALAPQAALAATGGNLMQRIRRLTMESRSPRTSPAPAASALLLVIVAAAMATVPAKLPVRHPRRLGVALAAATPQTAPIPQTLATPYQKWLREEVVYIVSNEERQAFIKLTTDEERENFIEQFWKRRDPSPDTVQNEFREEHYRRIAYANDHFAYQDLPGWKTDRGRIYITYGPPDQIDNRDAAQIWHYRLIEGIGTNVAIEFIDPTHSGEFRMTMDPRHEAPAPQAVMAKPDRQDVSYTISDQERAAFVRQSPGQEQAKVFVSADQPQVSVIVPGRRTSAGVIQPGDMLDVRFFARSGGSMRSVLDKKAQCAVLEGRYQADYPALQSCREELRSLEQAVDQLRADERILRERINSSVATVQNLVINQAQLNQHLSQAKLTEKLVSQVHAAQDEYTKMADQGIDNAVSSEAKRKLADAQTALAEAAEVSQRSQFQNLQSEISRINDRIGQEQQTQALLESSLSNNKKQQTQADAGMDFFLRQVDTRVTVGPEGRLALDGLGDLQAAGLSSAQLEAAIGQSASVRVEESPSRMVTVLVPLGDPSNNFHMFCEVLTNSHKIVSSFEDDVRNGPATARTVWLRPGNYHVKVVVKNVTTGATRTSDLDFVVD